MTIALTLGEDGTFTWKVQPEGGPPQTISGQADYQTGDEGAVLALLQPQGEPLAGKVENAREGQFDFQLLGGPGTPGSRSSVDGVAAGREVVAGYYSYIIILFKFKNANFGREGPGGLPTGVGKPGIVR